MLQGYERVDNIDDVPRYTHVRYVTLDLEQKQAFRAGGILLKHGETFVRIGNGRFMWNVSKKHYPRDQHGNQDKKQEPIFDTIFFKQISKLDKCITKIKQQQEIIDKLTKLIKSKDRHSITKNTIQE